MDLSVHGCETPRMDQSKHIRLNNKNKNKPVNKQTTHLSNSQKEERVHSRPADVPFLDLGFLQERETKTKLQPDLYNYELTSPTSVSVIECDKALDSQYDNRLWEYMSKASSGPHPDVPTLGFDFKENPTVSMEVKENIWDNAIVPEDLPGPSIKHRHMYKQYKEEMRNSYRQKNNPKKDAITNPQEEKNSKKVNKDEDDTILEQSFTQLKSLFPSFTERKLDVEESENTKKKEKLIETVMIDQLARSVICDPDQNKYLTEPHEYIAHRPRGANRFLHESSIQTQGSSTENLLSKRVRFGVRILTCNSHDALRELIGFFFYVDKTITIYEFRQFGKSSKALPFIKKGQYSSPDAADSSQHYTLCDIYPGSNLVLNTENQSCLPETLKSKPNVIFRVTDVAEKEKSDILLSGVKFSNHFPNVYAKLHTSYHKGDREKTKLLAEVQQIVQHMLKKRGVRTITGLGQHYRKLCHHLSAKDWCLSKSDLEDGLKEFHIDLPQKTLADLFAVIKYKHKDSLDYYLYMFAVIGQMNENRKHLVRKTYQKMGVAKNSSISIGEMRKFYHAGSQTKVMAGGTLYDAFELMLGVCKKSTKESEILEYIEWEEYYEGLSLGIQSDQEFENILKNLWCV